MLRPSMPPLDRFGAGRRGGDIRPPQAHVKICISNFETSTAAVASVLSTRGGQNFSRRGESLRIQKTRSSNSRGDTAQECGTERTTDLSCSKPDKKNPFKS